MLFGLPLLLGILTLLDEEEILLLEVGEDIEKLIGVLKVQLVLVVRVLNHLPQVFRDLHIIGVYWVTRRGPTWRWEITLVLSLTRSLVYS